MDLQHIINCLTAIHFKTDKKNEASFDIENILKMLLQYKQDQALQLQQTGVSGCFSYKEALEFLQLHTPIAVKPIKKSKYKFVQPFTSKNARDIVIFSLATELSKNNR